MTLLRTFFVVKKLNSQNHFNLSKLNVKFYSDTIVKTDKHAGNLCNSQNTIKEIRLSKKSVCENKTINEVTSPDNVKNKPSCQSRGTISVAIVGGGCASVCTTMLLKQNPAIKEIRIIDTDNSLIGPVCDIRQIDTSTVVKHYKRNSIIDGLRNTDIVALMDETHFTMGNEGPFSQFIASSDYVKSVTKCMINACPNALIAVFTHPVTATLPLVSEMYKYSGNWDPNKIIGSAALESMRISAMTASLLDLNPSFLSVPIAGGIDSLTVVPLLSRARPFNSFTKENECMLIHELRSADINLFASETKGPTLSSGVASAKFISTLINGLKKESISIASAYVRSDILPSCQYMTSEIQFGPNGVQQNFGLPKVSSREISLIEQAAPTINKIVNTAIHFLKTGKT